jgi:hypothetical protein
MLMRLRMLMVLVLLLIGILPAGAQPNELTLTLLGTYATGAFDEGAAEIVAYHPASQTLYVVNGNDDTVDLLSLSDPSAPTLTMQLDLSEYGDGANSVAVYGDLVAVAVEAETVDGNGMVAFFTPAGEPLNTVEVGVLPDMVTFTPDGMKVLTANEGEPSDDYTVDPEGSISIIDISGGVENATATLITFGDADIPEGVRVFGPGATPAQDLEPEYIAVTPDSMTAYVTLQENNALAVVDLATNTLSAVVALGFKDFNVEGSGIDASDEDGGINILPRQAFGMYLPDAIVAFETGGVTYLLTANEGDSRDYDGYSEEADAGELMLDAAAFPNAAEVQDSASLGRLEVTTTLGDSDGDGDYEAIYAFGTRSFSIWALDGALVYDSGDQLEQLTAAAYPDDFNSTNDENGSMEDRSDNAGPEPEGAVVATFNEQTYAFIGLERIGGVAVFNVTDPMAVSFVTYANNRDFSGDAAAGTAGDLGPEGLIVIAAEDSPTGAPLLVVSNEVSGTVSVFAIGM